VFGFAMDAIPPDGLLIASAAMALAYLILMLARIIRAQNPLTGRGR